MSRRVLVAGCGAAGMMAAIAAARGGAAVTVLEGMEKPGKKLLLTGNGRCNLTNLDPKLPEKYRTSAKNGSLDDILQQFSVADTLEFFHSLGLLTTEKNGYVYPYTGQAGSVLELLLAEMRRLKVKVKLSEKIRKIEKQEEGAEDRWVVQTETWSYRCDCLILCCGSRAMETTGSDGSGYVLAKQAGHTVAPVLPALTALTTEKRKFLAACGGVRCPAKVMLFAGPDGEQKFYLQEEALNGRSERKPLAEDTGELQFTENGISGIVVFQVSRYAALALHSGKKVFAVLDFLPEIAPGELERLIDQTVKRYEQTDVSVSSAFAGLLPKKLLTALLDHLKLRPGSAAAGLTPKQKLQFAQMIKGFPLPVTGSRPFSQSQVCAGGIPLSEIDPVTLESRKVSGLYFAGEILDVDGPCGGYNLQWAWSSGFTAGHHAAGF